MFKGRKEKKLKKDFEKIYDAHVDQIFRFTYLKVNSKEDAQDLTSKTFLKAWKAYYKMANASAKEKKECKEKNKQESSQHCFKNPRAFLYEVARNLVIDYYRKNRPDKKAEEERGSLEDGKKNKWKAQHVPIDDVVVVDREMRADEKAELNSQIEEVRNAMRHLSEDYQNIIIWYYLEELTTAEIAELLGKPESSIRVLIHRAVTSLKKKIDELGS